MTTRAPQEQFARIFSSRRARWQAFGTRELLSAWWEGNRYRYWLGLPWRCKFRHQPDVEEHWNGDAQAVEARWMQCGRCGHFIKHLDLS